MCSMLCALCSMIFASAGLIPFRDACPIPYHKDKCMGSAYGGLSMARLLYYTTGFLLSSVQRKSSPHLPFPHHS